MTACFCCPAPPCTGSAAALLLLGAQLLPFSSSVTGCSCFLTILLWNHFWFACGDLRWFGYDVFLLFLASKMNWWCGAWLGWGKWMDSCDFSVGLLLIQVLVWAYLARLCSCVCVCFTEIVTCAPILYCPNLGTSPLTCMAVTLRLSHWNLYFWALFGNIQW